MLTLAVFDLDGTLVDSRTDLANSANEMLASYGAAQLDAGSIAAFVGDGARMLVARSLKAAGLGAGELPDALVRFMEIYQRRLLEHTAPYEGVREVLDTARSRGAALAVITNKPKALSVQILEHFGLADHFRVVIGGDEAFPRKPDPASLAWTIGECGAEPAATLFVGDSQVDADTARAAGTRFCLASYGFGQARGPVDVRPGEWSAATGWDVRAAVEMMADAAQAETRG
jgi:phosphoglycolate phosphatase